MFLFFCGCHMDLDQDGLYRCLNSSTQLQATSTQNSITRKAGGRKEAEKEMQVIVDVREFMSSLPNMLHLKGMRIIPVTLEVGDYILSPLLCVERKSIQDLFSSFTSGRLYHQVESMVRYYRIPVLLIEFSQDKSFSFQSASDIGDDVTPNSIISKLSLLVLHFPRLRIIWSRSLYATAEIFASLKTNQDEPEEAKAIRVGVPSEEGIVENDVRKLQYVSC
ncbi:DNA repair endonuclease UVH1-like isoform X3 [Carica papaya]|uniref:DNA repair endonuclease UVH1-like isoform X3 n=1 Tax=Carica papaya TaxID=3649 RepID=UPI000B8CC7E5|nr:DNA repair endonuclease UVH1-like isoform X3 [Carica papaya]